MTVGGGEREREGEIQENCFTSVGYVVAAIRFLLWAAPFRVLFNNRTDSKKSTRLFSCDCVYAKCVCQLVCACVCVDINYLNTHTYRDWLNHAICQVIVGFAAE